MSKSTNQVELYAILDGCEWRYGIDGLPISVNYIEKEKYIMDVAVYYTIIKCLPMLDQLIEGLKYYDVRYTISIYIYYMLTIMPLLYLSMFTSKLGEYAKDFIKI